MIKHIQLQVQENVTLHNVNYGGGTVPAGAKVMSKEPTTVEPTTVIRDGAQVVVPTGQKLKNWGCFSNSS